MALPTVPPASPPVHFHIHWSGGELDYERFASVEYAEMAAQELVRREETYSVEAFDESCEKCAGLLRRMSKASGSK